MSLKGSTGGNFDLYRSAPAGESPLRGKGTCDNPTLGSKLDLAQSPEFGSSPTRVKLPQGDDFSGPSSHCFGPRTLFAPIEQVLGFQKALLWLH